MARIEQNRMTKERFEEIGRQIETRKRYFEAFEKLKNEEYVLVIDGNRSADEVARDIWEQTGDLFVK